MSDPISNRSPNEMRRQLTKNQLLHHDAGPKTLVWMVKFIFVVWFVRYLIDPFQTLSELPVAYSAPVGVLKFVPTWLYAVLHSGAALLVIRSLILAACVAVWIPRMRLQGAALGCTLLLIANTITRGFGHVNHAEIAPWLVTVILTFFMSRLPADQIECPDNNARPTASAGMVLSTLVFALTYSFVGAARLVNGGIGLLSGDSIPNSMLRMSHHDWILNFNFADMMVASPWILLMLKLGTAAVTVFELAAPLVLISVRFRKAFLLFIPAFHLGAIMVFKIDFIENVFTMMLFVNLTGWLNRQPVELPVIVPFRTAENCGTSSRI